MPRSHIYAGHWSGSERVNNTFFYLFHCTYKHYYFRITTSSYAKQIIADHKKLIEDIENFEKHIFVNWVADIPSEISISLKKSIIDRKHENPNLIVLNFDTRVCIFFINIVNYINIIN